MRMQSFRKVPSCAGGESLMRNSGLLINIETMQRRERSMRATRTVPAGAQTGVVSEIAKSALPPKADLCRALAKVCFEPIADMSAPQRSRSIDDFVGHLLQHQGHRYPERLRGLHVDQKLELGRLLDRQVGGVGALQDVVHIGRAPPGQGAGIVPGAGEAAPADTLALVRRFRVRGRQAQT